MQDILQTCVYRIFTGHLSYTSLVVVDSIHNNPVMNVFVYLLSVTAEAKAKSTEQEFQDSSGNHCYSYAVVMS